MPESPYFTSATTNIDESKKALLAAIAAGGDAGRQAFEQAQAGIESGRQAAVTRAAERARIIGGEAGLETAAPERYGQALTGLSTARAGFESGLAGTQASGESYFEKVRAALPFLQEQNRLKLGTRETEIQRAIELAKLRAEQEAAEEAAKLQREAEREARADARAAARGAGGDSLSDSELRTRLAGAGQIAFEEAPGLPTSQGTKIIGGPRMRIGPAPKGAAPVSLIPPQQTSGTKEQLAREIGLAAGLDPSHVFGLIKDPKVAAAKPPKPPKPADAAQIKQVATATKLTEADVREVLGNKDYDAARTDAYNWLAQGNDWSDLERHWAEQFLPGRERSYKMLLNEFKRLFSAAGL